SPRLNQMTTSSHIRTIGQQTTIFYSLNTFPVTYSQLNDLSTNRTKNGSSISRNKRMRIKERKKRNTRIQSTGKGLLNLINDGQEAIITLDMHKDEFELAVQRLHQSKARRIMNHFNRRTPPPLSLKCLKGNVLQAVKSYAIAPENYDVIRKSIKGHDQEWKTTVETMEKILQQLEAMSIWSITVLKLLSKVDCHFGYWIKFANKKKIRSSGRSLDTENSCMNYSKEMRKYKEARSLVVGTDENQPSRS
uniref:Reverse transcriptase domain-containing protein n=1 Tax=Loa loa TaxID=7209 RepID=A0A1I7VCM8_LOALO